MGRKKGKNQPESTGCSSCKMRERSRWGYLISADLQPLENFRACKSYEPGQVIFRQGSSCRGIHCVREGTVGIRRTNSKGYPALVRIISAGETAGHWAFFSGCDYPSMAEALTDCRVCFIEGEGIRGLMEENPSVGFSFLKYTALDLQESEEARIHASTLSVRARVANLLLNLKDRFATADEKGSLTIRLPIARRDMADLVGTRPETIARTIRSLEEDGVASFSGRTVTVPDLDALMDELETPGNRK